MGNKRTVIFDYEDSKDDVESCQFFYARIENNVGRMQLWLLIWLYSVNLWTKKNSRWIRFQEGF